MGQLHWTSEGVASSAVAPGCQERCRGRVRWPTLSSGRRVAGIHEHSSKTPLRATVVANGSRRPELRRQPSQKNATGTTDITYVSSSEGWLYWAAVEDLFTREIIGWLMSEKIDSRLVVDALQMALSRRQPPAGLIAHSDRGVQYASEHYQRLLREHGITCSMSRHGNCWGNAPMESFFAILKKELVHHEDYQTHAEARRSLFEHIEVFDNRQCRHSAIGYLPPSKFAEAIY